MGWLSWVENLGIHPSNKLTCFRHIPKPPQNFTLGNNAAIVTFSSSVSTYTQFLLPAPVNFGYLASIWHKPNSYFSGFQALYTQHTVVVEGVGRACTRASILGKCVVVCVPEILCGHLDLKPMLICRSNCRHFVLKLQAVFPLGLQETFNILSRERTSRCH